MQYTFLKCSKRTYTKTMPKFTMTQKVYFHTPKCTFVLDPIWHQKWNYMNPCFQTLQVLPSYSVFNNLFWTLPNLKSNKTQLIPNYNSLRNMPMTTSNCIRVKKDLTKDKYLQIQFYDGVFGNIKNKTKQKRFWSKNLIWHLHQNLPQYQTHPYQEPEEN